MRGEYVTRGEGCQRWARYESLSIILQKLYESPFFKVEFKHVPDVRTQSREHVTEIFLVPIRVAPVVSEIEENPL